MTTFTSYQDIKTIEQARAYLKRRAKDAVAAYREGDNRFTSPMLRQFTHPVELAHYIARYW